MRPADPIDTSRLNGRTFRFANYAERPSPECTCRGLHRPPRQSYELVTDWRAEFCRRGRKRRNGVSVAGL
jgi:hypothetical protein